MIKQRTWLLTILLLLGVGTVSPPLHAFVPHEVDTASLPKYVSLHHRNSDVGLMVVLFPVHSSVSFEGEYAFFEDEGMLYNKLKARLGIGVVRQGYGYVDTWFSWTHGNKHRLEMALGVALQYQHPAVIPEEGFNFSKTFAAPLYLIGYRYNYDSGLFLRAFINVLHDFNSTGFKTPYGLSFALGYAF